MAAEAAFTAKQALIQPDSVPERPFCFKSWAAKDRKTVIAADIVPFERKRTSTLVNAPSQDALDAIPRGLSRVEQVAYVAELMTQGIFRRGKTWRLLQEAWGLPRATIANITATASTSVKVALDPDAVKAALGETLDELLELAHQCKDSTDDSGRPDMSKEAIVAFKSAGDLCIAVVKDSFSVGSEKQLSDRDAHRRLVELGWTAPQAMLGLPMPDTDTDERIDDDDTDDGSTQRSD